MAVATTELVAAVDALCAVDPQALGDGDTLVALHRQLERLSAVTTRAVAAFDAGRAWEAEGARTCSAWLAVRWKVPHSSARRSVVLGRALRSMPAAEAAWLAGEVGRAQVGLLAGVATPVTEEFFHRDEAMLVAQAKKLGYRSFLRALAYWSQLADPDGADASAEARHEARRLALSQTFGGAWALEGLFGPIEGAIVEEFFRADWAWAERIVFAGPKRVKDVGVRTRIFAGATRRAVEVRDRECFHEFCEQRAECCEIDHVQPWSAGGLTVEANGRVACGFHNRERHNRERHNRERHNRERHNRGPAPP